MTPEELENILTNATEYRPQKLRNAGEFTDDVIAAFENKAGLLGVKTGIKSLDSIIKGWRGGELTVWTGPNGSGKSTVLGQVALNLVVRSDWTPGERVLIASLELEPKRYLRWLVCQQANTDDPSRAQIELAMRDISQGLWMFDHVGSVKLEPLLDTCEYAARRYGIRHFIVDSLVKLGISEEDYTGQVQAVSALCDFADRFDCHVHLVAHPRKQSNDDVQPDKAAVKGSGGITDLADNVIGVFRGDTGSLLNVLKNREHGMLGKAVVNVNPLSKRVTG